MGNTNRKKVASAVTDFTLSAYPFIILRKINMPIRMKASVMGLMSLGFVAGVLAIVRTVYSANNSKAGDPPCKTVHHNISIPISDVTDKICE